MNFNITSKSLFKLRYFYHKKASPKTSAYFHSFLNYIKIKREKPLLSNIYSYFKQLNKYTSENLAENSTAERVAKFKKLCFKK